MALPSSSIKSEDVSSEKKDKKHALFTSSLGVLMATLGSAVGLGNIWKFPSLTGSNGGAAFLIIYILCTLLVGLPIMIAEQMLGRKGRGDAVSTLMKLAPKKLWWLVGASGVLAAFCIMAFYSEVAGWVFAYIFKSIKGGLLSTDPNITSQAYTSLVSDPFQSLLWQWLVLAVTGAIIYLGVSKGIENTTKKLMPLLFILLVVVGIRGLTLPGAGKGLSFLFQPDFSKVTPNMILTAMGLAFFKLSVGMGCMITYGSYFREEQDIPKTAIRVMLADLSVSILAGIAIFPAVFAFGFEPQIGPPLLFMTIPSVFASMPLGNIFMVVFFLLTAVASIGAQLSLLEVIVAFLENRLGASRSGAAISTVLMLAVVGSTAALSNSSLSEVSVFGMTFFDLFDFVSSNLLLPVGGFFIAIFTGWVWGRSNFEQSLSNHGSLQNLNLIHILFWILRWITPLLVLVILFSGLDLF